MTFLHIKVTTKASSNRIGEFFTAADGTPVLKVYVTAVPENGKANLAVIKLLAKKLKIAKSDIEIVKGVTDSNKMLHINGKLSF